MQMPDPEIHHRTTKVNGLTIQQVMSKTKECAKLQGCQYLRGPTIIRPRAQLHISLQNLYTVVAELRTK